MKTGRKWKSRLVLGLWFVALPLIGSLVPWAFLLQAPIDSSSVGYSRNALLAVALAPVVPTLCVVGLGLTRKVRGVSVVPLLPFSLAAVVNLAASLGSLENRNNEVDLTQISRAYDTLMLTGYVAELILPILAVAGGIWAVALARPSDGARRPQP